MRLKLTLTHKPNQALPINYQYLIAAWVYRTLGTANSVYATHLHEQGYDFAGKTYKLFTYSALRPRWFDIDKRAKAFILAKSPTELTLSFYMDDALQHFVIGLFKDQQFTLESGRYFKVAFEVVGIETLSTPVFKETMRFRAVTPICLSRNEEGKAHAQYLSPELPEYGELLLQNLLRKYLAVKERAVLGKDLLSRKVSGENLANPQPPDLLNLQDLVNLNNPNFRLLNTPKSKLLAIKGVKMRGFLFYFEITSPVELIRVGYFGGFGVGNSALGMGMVRVLK